MNAIRVLIVDDITETRENIRRILAFDNDIAVIGEARDGMEAIQKVQALGPDVILMDVNMPKMDGISAAEKISQSCPGCSIIFVSVQGEPEYLRRAMMAGARDYLIKPFAPDDLISTIKRAYQAELLKNPAVPALKESKHHVVTVFGTKGGVGKTTIAVNLAVLLAQTKKKVAVLDLDLQFGDVSIFLNLLPKRTIAELAQDEENLNHEMLDAYLIPHISGIKILPAPGRPEYAELVTAAHIEKIITLLRADYDYVIIDTPPLFNETNLTALDLSSQILLALSMDLATIKNVKLSLELLDSLHHRGKTKMILNRSSDDVGIKAEHAEETLGFLIAAQIPSDGKLCVSALNKGIPFVMSDASAKISQAIRYVSELVIKDKGYQEDLKASRRGTFLGRLFR